MSSTSSSPSSSLSSSVIRQDKYKYDVFLSFSGQDTRATITSHIYKALRKDEIPTFFDEDGLLTGDSIALMILDAIEKSKVSVIVFSAPYASSLCCMDELLKILDCRERYDQEVIPVFYRVCPSELRNQTGRVGDEFVKLSAKLPEEKVRSRYRAALSELSSITGLESKKFRSDATLVEKVVSEVREKLKKISLSTDHEGPVGLKPHVDDIISLLDIKLSDHEVVGICGEPGVGKTTLARVVYDNISSRYEGYSFVANVDKEIQKKGIALLTLRILSEIVNEKVDPINGTDIHSVYEDRLKGKKVFMVLDDVGTSRTIGFLISDTFYKCGSDSRAIIVTEDRKALEERGVLVSHIYEVKRLTDGNDLQLFLNCAFKQGPLLHENEKFKSLSEKIVPYAKGHPLCLKTLGFSLRHKKIKAWESVLNALKDKDCSTLDIQEVIKICHGKLLDEKEQIIFIDFPRYFEGKNMKETKTIVEDIYGRGWCEALDALIDKSIITESSGKLNMHRLFGETAATILKEKFYEKPEIFPRDNITEGLNGSSRSFDDKDIVDFCQNVSLASLKSTVVDSSLRS